MTRQQIKILGQGKYLRLVRDGHWEFADRIRGTGVVAIIAVTPDDELVLTEQFRPAVGSRVIDIPAGIVGDVEGEENEEFVAAARRELLEETGYTARNLKLLLRCPTSAGMVTEVAQIFLAKKAVQVGDGGGDESEDIQVHVIPRTKLYSWLKRQARAGRLIDAKCLMAMTVLDHEL